MTAQHRRTLPGDTPERQRALLDHATSMQVEAGAGTGKTTLMAGRIAMLLCAGTHPRQIAAITFTELAAAELKARIAAMTRALAHGTEVVGVSEIVGDLNETARTNLDKTMAALEEMTCTTIHGFCHRILERWASARTWPPGRRISEAATTKRREHRALAQWARTRTMHDDADAIALAEMLIEREGETLELLAEIGRQEKLLEHAPSQEQTQSSQMADTMERFAATAQAFVQGLRDGLVDEPETAAAAAAFKELAGQGQRSAGTGSAHEALQMRRLRAASTVTTATGGWRAYRKKSKWMAAAKDAGIGKNNALTTLEAMQSHYEACTQAWDAVIESATQTIREAVVRLARDAQVAYETAKREEAVADFDDLIVAARTMLREEAQARDAVRERYRYLLVDEFQDTDPAQAEIVWRAASASHTQEWRDGTLRPGALFTVGDPKQAIYGFRGADVRTYLETKRIMAKDRATAQISIRANFRCRPALIRYVNEHFAKPLDHGGGQPGFIALEAARPEHDDGGELARLPNSEPRADASADDARASEAQAVARLCAGWIATGAHGAREPSDIALLAPTGTGLWRYEDALIGEGLPFASQAGKGFFQRQETQDLIAAVRAIDDPGDAIAIGALLRGPLCGTTDETLLDIAVHLGKAEDHQNGLGKLDARTNPALLGPWPVVQATVAIIAQAARTAWSRSPYETLENVIEALDVREIVGARPNHKARGEANIDKLLALSRHYDQEGLGTFAQYLGEAWQNGERLAEGRPDNAGDAIAIQTIHSAKGLEWPTVVVINTAGATPNRTAQVLNAANAQIVFKLFGAPTRGYEAAADEEQAERERERVRLWYVATTRARERLVLPHGVGDAAKAWSRVVEL